MLEDRLLDGSKFLQDVELKGKLIEEFKSISESNNKILIYEYFIEDKNYNIVIIKQNNEYLNFYLKLII